MISNINNQFVNLGESFTLSMADFFTDKDGYSMFYIPLVGDPAIENWLHFDGGFRGVYSGVPSNNDLGQRVEFIVYALNQFDKSLTTKSNHFSIVVTSSKKLYAETDGSYNNYGVYFLRDGNDNEILYGAKNSHNSMWGGDGDDVLIGGDLQDIMWGGDGDDELIGGGDDDIFKYNYHEWGHDTIEDFQNGSDVIRLSDLFIYQTINNNNIGDFIKITDNGNDAIISIDSNGDGSGADVTITLVRHAEVDLDTMINNGTLEVLGLY